MLSPLFIQFDIAFGEAELSLRLRYSEHPLSHKARLHRKQGVYAPIHLVCSCSPCDCHKPILTTYNQDRLHP